MEFSRICVPRSWLWIYLAAVSLSLVIQTNAMTISRQDLSQLFSRFLDDLEKNADDTDHADNIDAVKQKARETAPEILDLADSNPRELAAELTGILRDINHVETELADNGIQPPSILKNAQTADELLVELLNESRKNSREGVGGKDIDDPGRIENDDESDVHDKVVMEYLRVGLTTPTTLPSMNHETTTNEPMHTADDDLVEEYLRVGLTTPTTLPSMDEETTTNEPVHTTTEKYVHGHSIPKAAKKSKPSNNIAYNDDKTDEDTNNSQRSQAYAYAQCDLRLNEGLEPRTLARYHGFKGTVNIRQHKSNGSREVLIRIYGLNPHGPEAHGIYIRESGDLSHGCGQLGGIFDPVDALSQESRRGGHFSPVCHDTTGFAELRATVGNDIDLMGEHSIYGRSIVVYEGNDSNSAPIGCCVIGRSRAWRIWL